MTQSFGLVLVHACDRSAGRSKFGSMCCGSEKPSCPLSKACHYVRYRTFVMCGNVHIKLQLSAPRQCVLISKSAHIDKHTDGKTTVSALSHGAFNPLQKRACRPDLASSPPRGRRSRPRLSPRSSLSAFDTFARVGGDHRKQFAESGLQLSQARGGAKRLRVHEQFLVDLDLQAVDAARGIAVAAD